MTAFRVFSACLCLLLLFCACTGDFTGRDEPLPGACPEEPVLSDGGLAAVQGDWVYYINGDNFVRGQGERYHEFAGALCRMRRDGTEKDVVVDRDVSLFHVRGNAVYLCVYENGKSVLALCSTDGTSYKRLARIDDIYTGGCCDFAGEWIYFTKDYRLYRTDGTHETKLTDFPVYNLRCGDTYTYFTEELDGTIGRAFRLKNGEDTYSAITKGSAYVLSVSGDTAYFYLIDNERLYRYDAASDQSTAVLSGKYTEFAFAPDGIAASGAEEEQAGVWWFPFEGDAVRLSEDDGACMTVFDGFVYFVDRSKLNYLFRVSLDGTEECLSEEFVLDREALDLCDNWLYFLSDSDYDRIYRCDTETKYTVCVELEDVSVVG